MSILSGVSFEFFSHSAEQTRRLGMRLGTYLKVGSLICLQGDLGAGKTTFVQGVASGWGSLDRVSSPTFQLVNEYRRSDGTRLFHLDSYRIQSISEGEELDLDSMLTNGSVLVEWPEMLQGILPSEYLWVKFVYQDEFIRELTFCPNGKTYIDLVEKFHKQIVGN